MPDPDKETPLSTTDLAPVSSSPASGAPNPSSLNVNLRNPPNPAAMTADPPLSHTPKKPLFFRDSAASTASASASAAPIQPASAAVAAVAAPRPASEPVDADALARALRDYDDAGRRREPTPGSSPSRKRQRVYGDRYVLTLYTAFSTTSTTSTTLSSYLLISC
jgi:hypothetical protein